LKALVILSGGQDSTTCLFWALQKYGAGNVFAIGFDYNQRHKAELDHAKNICEENNVEFTIFALPVFQELGSNALTNPEIEVDARKPENSPPNTLVEGRNILFLTYAAIFAKSKGIQALVAGVSESDYSGYPDCRDMFVKACNLSLNLGMDYPFIIETPLMWLNKARVWQLAHQLGVLETVREKTLTCYNGIVGDGCGNCPACDLRKKGYEEFLSRYKNKEPLIYV
jgi:7-cyano-7-deazaguanine synthase